MTSTSLKDVVLNDHRDWMVWIEVIKASSKDLWSYVDPTKTTLELKTLVKPIKSTPANVKTGATTYSELSADEKEQLRSLQDDYRTETSRFEKRSAALGELRKLIIEKISVRNL